MSFTFGSHAYFIVPQRTAGNISDGAVKDHTCVSTVFLTFAALRSE